MAAHSVPPEARRSAPRGGEAGWSVAPGAAVDRPARPDGLGSAGAEWWDAAWSSAVSGMWLDADVMQVRRAAKLADACAGDDVKATMLVELRRLEDALGLTPVGRLRLRVRLPGEPADGQEVDELTARRRRSDDRRQRLSA